MTLDDLTLDATQSIDIKADIGDVFRSMLHRFGEGSTNAKGESMQMTLEQWPGHRQRPRPHRYRPSLGACSGDQATGAVGTERPYVHVLPGAEPHRREA